jgi:predicted alpha/beta hydrolase
MKTHPHRITTPDGWHHDVLELEPPGPARATVIGGHAMLANRSTFFREDRPTLGATLVDRGIRCLVHDLRGRGGSGPGARRGGSWRFDELVDDMAAYLDFARRRAAGGPLVVVGHSLFSVLALAQLGRAGGQGVDGVVAMGALVQGRRLVRSWRRWLWQRLIVELVALAVGVLGYVPPPRRGRGASDESREFWRDVVRFLRHDRFTSRAGEDYQAGFARVTCPVLAVVSEADGHYAHPEESLRFLAPVPRLEVLRLGRGAWAHLAPTHAGMLTDRRSQPLWDEIARWVGAIASRSADPPARAAS